MGGWVVGWMGGWMASMGDPDIIRSEFQELREKKAHLYSVSSLGQVLYLMSHNPKSNPMISTF